MKGRLNRRPIRIFANPSHFKKKEVNFMETMFYDELTPDDECPTLGTLRAPTLKEEEGSNTYDLRDLLDRKRQKKENSSSRSRECVVVRKLEGRLIYHL